MNHMKHGALCVLPIEQDKMAIDLRLMKLQATV